MGLQKQVHTFKCSQHLRDSPPPLQHLISSDNRYQPHFPYYLYHNCRNAENISYKLPYTGYPDFYSQGLITMTTIGWIPIDSNEFSLQYEKCTYVLVATHNMETPYTWLAEDDNKHYYLFVHTVIIILQLMHLIYDSWYLVHSNCSGAIDFWQSHFVLYKTLVFKSMPCIASLAVIMLVFW